MRVLQRQGGHAPCSSAPRQEQRGRPRSDAKMWRNRVENKIVQSSLHSYSSENLTNRDIVMFRAARQPQRMASRYARTTLHAIGHRRAHTPLSFRATRSACHTSSPTANEHAPSSRSRSVTLASLQGRGILNMSPAPSFGATTAAGSPPRKAVGQPMAPPRSVRQVAAPPVPRGGGTRARARARARFRAACCRACATGARGACPRAARGPRTAVGASRTAR